MAHRALFYATLAVLTAASTPVTAGGYNNYDGFNRYNQRQGKSQNTPPRQQPARPTGRNLYNPDYIPGITKYKFDGYGQPQSEAAPAARYSPPQNTQPSYAPAPIAPYQSPQASGDPCARWMNDPLQFQHYTDCWKQNH